MRRILAVIVELISRARRTIFVMLVSNDGGKHLPMSVSSNNGKVDDNGHLLKVYTQLEMSCLALCKRFGCTRQYRGGTGMVACIVAKKLNEMLGGKVPLFVLTLCVVVFRQ
jgi:hypothetical protein